ncbi:MAG: gluconeogenesis factor YvcK family protein [Patescibacteria group bacterium]|jgi:uncharacterized cofD-like protein
MHKRRVVAIGGGTGLYTLLRGLRQYDIDLSAVVTMMDDGGSTGVLRDEFGVLPPGDVRRCIVALSESPELMKKLFQYRFDRGALSGHSFGNLFITALREITGSDDAAIAEAAHLLHVRGRVLPVTLESRRLRATLENGQVIEGETNIDLPQHDGRLRIRELALNAPASANPKVLDALGSADLIVLGPGDLYGSIIANLLVTGVRSAIQHSRARVVYVVNLMTKYGETHGFRLHDFVLTMEQYLGEGVIDYVVFSDSRIPPAVRASYASTGAEPVRVDRRELRQFGVQFVRAPLASRGDVMRHDSRKLARVLWGLLQLDNEITFVE